MMEPRDHQWLNENSKFDRVLSHTLACFGKPMQKVEKNRDHYSDRVRLKQLRINFISIVFHGSNGSSTNIHSIHSMITCKFKASQNGTQQCEPVNRVFGFWTISKRRTTWYCTSLCVLSRGGIWTGMPRCDRISIVETLIEPRLHRGSEPSRHREWRQPRNHSTRHGTA